VTSAVAVNGDLSDWESVIMEHEHWTVLVRQLEDLLAVQSLLLMKPAPTSFNKPPWELDTPSVTLKRVLGGGKGECVCVCLVHDLGSATDLELCDGVKTFTNETPKILNTLST